MMVTSNKFFMLQVVNVVWAPPFEGPLSVSYVSSIYSYNLNDKENHLAAILKIFVITSSLQEQKVLLDSGLSLLDLLCLVVMPF